MNIVKEEISNFLKTNEQFDSPDAKKRFGSIPQAEINKIVDIQPYKNQFNSNTYQGNMGGDLHDLIDNTMHANKDSDAYASIEFLYRTLIKEIPEFKSFKIETTHMESKTHYLMLVNNIQIKDKTLNDDYSVKVQLWIKYHVKSDKYLDYKKDRIYLLFAPQITVTRTGIGMRDIGTVFPPNGEVNDNFVDDFLGKTNKLLYGSPDDEDDYMEEKYKLSYKNLQLDTFNKILPILRTKLFEFNKYVKNKYNISVI